MRKVGLSLFFLAFLLASPQVVSASSIYNLTTSNFGDPGPFGTVTVTLNSGKLDVVVALIDDTYVFHSNGAFGFDVVGSDVAGLTITGLNGPFSYPGGTDVAYDGFGKFEFSIDSSESASTARANLTDTLNFTVSRTSGFSADTQLAELNNKGWFFAAQIAPVDATQPTGFVGGAGTNPPPAPRDVPDVPEPASLLLLGSGLAMVARRFRHRL